MKLPLLPKLKNTSVPQRPEPSSPLLVTPQTSPTHPSFRADTTQADSTRLIKGSEASASDEGSTPTTSTSSRSGSISSASYHDLGACSSSFVIAIEEAHNPFRSPKPNTLDYTASPDLGPTIRHPIRSEGTNSQTVIAPFIDQAIDGQDRIQGLRIKVDEATLKEDEFKRLWKESKYVVKGLKKDLKRIVQEEKTEKKKQKKEDKLKGKGKGKEKEMEKEKEKEKRDL
ncbi:BQ2448_983 [Microbotryum intermedium]|uniref:BQ2448_983 protein n=1 Tax=Microbotryum intermedium TaxID=269621 RepID=A0A238F4D8_9BASI|nr:BQ2448_983 [Microbotryum intermedium]